MFGFLGFILIFILVIVFVVIAILGNMVRAIFGIGKRAPKQYHEENRQSAQQASPTSNHGKKKIFAEDEGEYVEYEEVQ